MLTICVPSRELFDEETEEFLTQDSFSLELEHSLVSLSKWESKFEKAFLTAEAKTRDELNAYIEFMILDPVYPEDIHKRLTPENIDQITKYIESSQTATKFGKLPERKARGETITSELIYYWLVTFNISFEVERWHLNRLFALVRVCNLKNTKPTPKSKQELARSYREINAQRKAELNTSG